MRSKLIPVALAAAVAVAPLAGWAPAARAQATPVAASASAEGALAAFRAALRAEVPAAEAAAPDQAAALVNAARAALDQAGETVAREQIILVVDRNPAVQRLALVLAGPETEWEVLALEKVSTGQAGRRGYFITPVGVFPHSTAIRDYRAEGTYNENGIRGLGAKGSRVWDFGWNQAQPGWLPASEPPREMRLLLHATDPDQLEQRLGRTASMGCIRISAALNRFLDRRGVLDVDHEASLLTGDQRHRAVLHPEREPAALAGRLLVVLDSADPS
jgi:hypothetical protein